MAAGLAPRSRSSEPGIYLIAIDGGDARAITRPERPTFHFSPVFSPDGHHLVFASCNSTGLTSGWLLPQKCSVAMVDIDESLRVTGTPRTLAAQVVYPSGMAWSPDGRWIVFVGESGGSAKLLRVSVDGTHDAEPIELAGSHAAHPAAPPARDRLVFSRYDWEAHLYRFAPGHPLERFAPSSSFELDPHFSPDGRQIAFASGRSGEVAIWVAAADGSEARQFTSHRWVWQGSPNWSPDGRTIAFDAFDPDNHVHVWTIPAEGGTPRRITGPTGDQARPTWSRDGRWIYFSEAREGGRDIWRVPATGGPAERITRDGSGYLAYETADGVNILYQPRYGDSPVLIAPLDGAGPARRIIDCARAASFVPAGNAIVYAGCEPGTTPSLRSLDTVTGRDRVLGTLEHFPSDPLGVGLAVSQDRKTILFSGLMRRGADLMLIEDLR